MKELDQGSHSNHLINFPDSPWLSLTKINNFPDQTQKSLNTSNSLKYKLYSLTLITLICVCLYLIPKGTLRSLLPFWEDARWGARRIIVKNIVREGWAIGEIRQNTEWPDFTKDFREKQACICKSLENCGNRILPTCYSYTRAEKNWDNFKS